MHKEIPYVYVIGFSNLKGIMKKLHILALILAIALAPFQTNGAFYQSQEYEGYRLYFHFASVVKKKSDWMLIKFSVINTGKNEIAFGADNLPDNIILNFDDKILETEIGENLEAFRSALYASDIKLIPGQNLDKQELRITMMASQSNSDVIIADNKKTKKEKVKKKKIKNNEEVVELQTTVEKETQPVETETAEPVETLVDHIEERTNNPEAEADFGSSFENQEVNSNLNIEAEVFETSIDDPEIIQIESSQVISGSSSNQNQASSPEDEGVIFLSDITEPLEEESEVTEVESVTEVSEVEKVAEVEKVEKVTEVKEVEKVAEVTEVEKVTEVKEVAKVEELEEGVEALEKVTEVEDVVEVVEVEKMEEVKDDVEVVEEVKEMEKVTDVEVTEVADEEKELKETEVSKSEKVEESAKEESLFSFNTNSDEEEEYFDASNCADLVVQDIKILKNSKRSVTLEYTITNQGAGPAHLYGKGRILEDNLALRAHMSSSEKISKGAILITGDFLPNAPGSKPLNPDESVTATIKLEKFKMTKFTPYIILELDTFQNIIECDETNNRKAIKVE